MVPRLTDGVLWLKGSLGESVMDRAFFATSNRESPEIPNAETEIKLRAKRRADELLAEMDRNKGAQGTSQARRFRPCPLPSPQQLSDALRRCSRPRTISERLPLGKDVVEHADSTR